MAIDLSDPGPEFLAFWRERLFPTLTTLRPDGSPHVVPVGVTYDPEHRLARIITRRTSRKAAHVGAAQPDGARVAVCQVDVGRWATVEEEAWLRTEPVRSVERRVGGKWRRRVSPEQLNQDS